MRFTAAGDIYLWCTSSIVFMYGFLLADGIVSKLVEWLSESIASLLLPLSLPSKSGCAFETFR